MHWYKVKEECDENKTVWRIAGCALLSPTVTHLVAQKHYVVTYGNQFFTFPEHAYYLEDLLDEVVKRMILSLHSELGDLLISYPRLKE